MIQADVIEDERVTLRNAVLQMKADNLWSPEHIKPLFSLTPLLSQRPWEVELALDERRREESRRTAVSRVRRETAFQKMIEKDNYDDFSAITGGVTRLLDEYDDLKMSPDSALRYVPYESSDFEYLALTSEQSKALRRLYEVRSALSEKGIKVLVRDELISLLVEFDLALSKVHLTNGSLGDPSCPLLEPTASYLAKPEIQSSYLTRSFALCFLGRLRMSVAPQVKIASRLAHPTIWVAIAILGVWHDARELLIALVLEQSLLFACLALAVTLGARWVLRGVKANRILTNLINQLSYVGAPCTCDGRELTEELRKLERLNVVVPSVVFSLFRITLPGR